MAKAEYKYYAWLSNDAGVTLDVPHQTGNKSELKKYIRSRYSGWTVHIMRVDIDGDGQSVLGAPHEVETFRLRGR